LRQTEQAFLVSRDQSFDVLCETHLFAAQRFLPLSPRIAISCGFFSPIHFGLHQRVILQQTDDLVPHDLI
jgi:hypothetical protein